MKNMRTDILDDKYGSKDFLLSEDERLDLEHDIQWGKHLYELHTRGGTIPVTLGLAATLPTRDLECIILYSDSKTVDFQGSSVPYKTITACAHELVLRDERIEVNNERFK